MSQCDAEKEWDCSGTPRNSAGRAKMGTLPCADQTPPHLSFLCPLPPPHGSLDSHAGHMSLALQVKKLQLEADLGRRSPSLGHCRHTHRPVKIHPRSSTLFAPPMRSPWKVLGKFFFF